jgi:hypothetical protein
VTGKAKGVVREKGASVAKIQIGLASAREYLEQQVAPAYSRFLDVPSQENALSAAATLWDTRGWIDQKASPAAAKALSEDLLARCPDLGLIHDLADAAKHSGELDRSSVLVKGISGSGSPGGATFTSSPLGTFQSTPECTLQIDLKNGGHRDMKEALATVHKFLRAECPDWVFSMGARFPGLRKAIGESGFCGLWVVMAAQLK